MTSIFQPTTTRIIDDDSSSMKHVASFTTENNIGWTPSYIDSEEKMRQAIMTTENDLDLIDKDFFNISALEDSVRRRRHEAPTTTTSTTNITSTTKEMLGFIRIPKTGSTSILAMLNASGNIPHHRCILGALGDERSDYPKHHFNDNLLGCPHLAYARAVQKVWTMEILPLLLKQKLLEQQSHNHNHNHNHNHSLTVSSTTATTTTTATATAPTQYSYSLQLFTIVRDPFDRLTSLFHYMRRIHPEWSRQLTEEQTSAMLANNLTEWMELLAKSSNIEMLQKDFFANRKIPMARAINLIQGKSPRIFTVTQDCFEASIHLLVDKFPKFFSAHVIIPFLNASSSVSRRNTRSGFQKKNKKKQDNDDELRVLREKAKDWFPDEFTFYEAAVQQFRERLVVTGASTSTSLEPSLVQSCLLKLDQKTNSTSTSTSTSSVP